MQDMRAALEAKATPNKKLEAVVKDLKRELKEAWEEKNKGDVEIKKIAVQRIYLFVENRYLMCEE